MADIGHLSDTDDSEVEELVSQALELSVLEQVSKINCSGFGDSVIPTDLENRFLKLKSFPLSRPKTPTSDVFHQKSLSDSKFELDDDSPKGKRHDGSVSGEESGIFSCKKQYSGGKVSSLTGEREIFLDAKRYPEGKLCLQKESRSGCTSSPFNSSNSSMGEDIFSPKEDTPDVKGAFKKKFAHGSVSSSSDCWNPWVENSNSSPSQKLQKKKSVKSKAKHGSLDSPLVLSNSFRGSPSPPRRAGCFWCSPKSVSKKNSKENWNLDLGDKDGDDFLSELGTFSLKEQRKMLKKAMKEEQKISREAEKIVKMAKQASARMSFHGIEDDLSDDYCRK